MRQNWLVDIEVQPGLVIPANELEWQFSRASGPGGQHVNTSDSRAQLTWNIEESDAIDDSQRDRLLARLDARLVAGAITVQAAEQRSQLRNRESAAEKLAEAVRRALAPPPKKRKATKPTRGSQKRHRVAKTSRSGIKELRRKPTAGD